MTPHAHLPIAFLMKECPFSFKFLLFMTEAGLLDEIDIRYCDRNDESFKSIKGFLAEKCDKVSFPTVEILPEVYMKDSDVLIEHFAKKYDILNKHMPVLNFYETGVFASLNRLFGEYRNVKSQLAAYKTDVKPTKST
ncbi:MAG: hypothetical protein V7776_23520 [Halopseudomonas aestusnigri]